MNLLLQCFLILLALAVSAVVLSIAYQVTLDILDEVNQKLTARNVNVSSTGVKVGVKRRDRERYLDGVQRQFVNAWNKSQTLGYSGSWLFGKSKDGGQADKGMAGSTRSQKKVE